VNLVLISEKLVSGHVSNFPYNFCLNYSTVFLGTDGARSLLVKD
jgi:hypothetical protein